MSKRSRFELYGDILESIREDISRNGTARLTRVQVRVQVPYDRFKLYIENMKKGGLVEAHQVDGHEEILLTSKAYEYLSEYEHIKSFLATFGLQEINMSGTDTLTSYGSVASSGGGENSH